MMRGIGNLLVVLAVVAAVGFGVIAAIRAVFGGLFDGLSSSKLADLATLAVVFAAFVVLVVRSGDWAGALIWRGRTSQPKQDAPVIDTTWRELPNYQQPMAQLPAPRTIRVPVYSAMGKPQPMGAPMATATSAPAPETVLESFTRDNEGRTVKLEVSYRYLLRFASLKGPSRDEWTGRPAAFYQCQKFFNAHGFLKPNGRTLVWKDEYPIESRKSWLYQFEPGAREIEHSPTLTDEGTAGESL